MPIYEFRCNSCDSEFEKLIMTSVADECPECPHCNSLDLERILSMCSMNSRGTHGSGSNCQSRPTGFR